MSKPSSTPAAEYHTPDLIARFVGLSGSQLKLKTRSLEEFFGKDVQVMVSGIFTTEDGDNVFFTTGKGQVLGTWGDRLRVVADGQTLLVTPDSDSKTHQPTYWFYAPEK